MAKSNKADHEFSGKAVHLGRFKDLGAEIQIKRTGVEINLDKNAVIELFQVAGGDGSIV